MPTKADLLLEKKRYGLKQVITDDELKKLESGWPVQLIMGYVEYANVRINLNHKVLIPRYETEELIYIFLKQYAKPNMKVLDLCCGSGFIGIALKKNMPSLDVTMSDVDDNAIKQSNENIMLNFPNHNDIKIIKSDCFNEIKGKFDVIISNPPYVAFDDKDVQKDISNFEPFNAIFAPDNGWYFYNKIIEEAPNFLNKNGLLIFEINPNHMNKWSSIKNVVIKKDMAGKERFAFIKFV
ncbi:peptide chain release factor N(5)-glutamine methyltransferase [Mycoplasmopsis primatum]|uniref:peptide chain release factor N(5)-glutamine methyltransferase n=1 Tax=Mycoplasmopsis primatum TaxID=55604 RepID=UPI00049604F8|nr:peptide chain release factor N(5)-glutamine methyltransferase [Mycoplasmopsis primatum]